MNLQLDFPTHDRENNLESEQHLYENKKHFSDKGRMVLTRLCNGERLEQAREAYSIASLSRRACDLIELGIPVQRTFKPSTRIKEYWLKPEDIEWVRVKFSQFLIPTPGC